MILSVQLSTTTYDSGCNRTYHDTFYIDPQTLVQGVYVNRYLPPQYHGFVGSIRVCLLPDGSGVGIQSARYGDRVLPVGGERTYRTPRIALDYACCELCLEVLPPCKAVWDELRVAAPGITVGFGRGQLAVGDSLRLLLEQRGDRRAGLLPFRVSCMAHNSVQLTDERGGDTALVCLDRPCTFKGICFELVSHSVQLTEWDPGASCPRQFLIDSRQWAESCHSADAALAVAESIAAQMPEALEIIACYMRLADDLGSADARAWLANYSLAGNSR